MSFFFLSLVCDKAEGEKQGSALSEISTLWITKVLSIRLRSVECQWNRNEDRGEERWLRWVILEKCRTHQKTEFFFSNRYSSSAATISISGSSLESRGEMERETEYCWRVAVARRCV